MKKNKRTSYLRQHKNGIAARTFPPAPGRKRRSLLFAALLFASALLLVGCKESTVTEPITATGFKLNTVVQITVYDSTDKSLLDESMKLCDEYEAIFSRTSESSELYRLNHRELPPVAGTGNTYRISQPLAELLDKSFRFSRESAGAFDVTIAPLSSLWDFTGENPEVPDEELLREACAACDYEKVQLDGQLVTLKSPDTAFDLGAIAKGYIADRIKEYLISQGVNSAVINLGGNVLCIGAKPDGTPFKIGIQKPFADRSETIATMDIDGKSVVSSGIYERYFKKDGILYHHILNPRTGYPCDNDLTAVTIISDDSVDGDGLSTVCFALGLEKGLAYANSLENIQAFFVTKDSKIYYTDHFQDEISVSKTAKGAR